MILESSLEKSISFSLAERLGGLDGRGRNRIFKQKKEKAKAGSCGLTGLAWRIAMLLGERGGRGSVEGRTGKNLRDQSVVDLICLTKLRIFGEWKILKDSKHYEKKCFWENYCGS